MPGPHYNLARFDFVSIRLAVGCARTGSLTAAARECNLVRPAASRRIRDLERALGISLFERHSRGLTPTASGRVFLKRGMLLLQELDKLVEELSDAQQGVVRHVRLCSSTAAIGQFLPPLLAEYADLRPEVQVELEEQVSEYVVATLREGRADVGVFVEGPDVRGLDVRDFELQAMGYDTGIDPRPASGRGAPAAAHRGARGAGPGREGRRITDLHPAPSCVAELRQQQP